MRWALALLLLLAGALALAGPAAAQEVRGDFDRDGYSDLAVGIIGEQVGGVERAGAVAVIYGGPNGLSLDGSQRITQLGAVFGDPQEGAMFGATLAAGDFDGDSFADLAVGAPSYDPWGDRSASGLVVVLSGSGSGLRPDEQAWWFVATGGAEYGSALTAGDFDADGVDDLAVGAPGWRALRKPDVGAVEILYGSRFGLQREQWWWEATDGVAEMPDSWDRFGSALAAGDFDGDGADDLAVGVPRARVWRYRGADEAGYVHVLYGSGEGLTAERADFWSQASRGIGSSPEEGDRFGATLAAGDFDRNGADDLAVGSPGETDDGCPRACTAAGAVHVLYGVEDEGLSAAGSLLSRPTWGASQPRRYGYGTALAVGDFDADRADDLAVGTPGWEVMRGVQTGRGLVRLLFGSEDGLGERYYDLVPFSEGSLRTQELMRFGAALAAGDFDGDGAADLAVGAPYFDVALKHGLLLAEDGGAVYTFLSEQDYGPHPSSCREWIQGESFTGSLGRSDAQDFFGWALAP